MIWGPCSETTTDIDGIMLLAIQALEQRTVKLQEELRKAREELAQLQAEKEAGVAGVESP
jgi:predicted  nucleic acid-binding Zn-ribbon protein